MKKSLILATALTLGLIGSQSQAAYNCTFQQHNQEYQKCLWKCSLIPFCAIFVRKCLLPCAEKCVDKICI